MIYEKGTVNKKMGSAHLSLTTMLLYHKNGKKSTVISGCGL
jgi:hypothetical protein